MHLGCLTCWQMSKRGPGRSGHSKCTQEWGYSQRAFDGLVTCDATCAYFYEPKWKCSYRAWITGDVKGSAIAKRTQTFKTIMYVIFFDYKGPALQIPVPREKTVTAKLYRNVAIRKLKKIYYNAYPKQASSNSDSCMIMQQRIRRPWWLSFGNGRILMSPLTPYSQTLPFAIKSWFQK